MIINKKSSKSKETPQAKPQPRERESLDGRDNKRLNAKKPTNSEGTAAWQNSATRYQEDNVNKPSIERVIDAKDWVDNGSRL